MNDDQKKVLDYFNIVDGVLVDEIRFLLDYGMNADDFINRNKHCFGVKLLKGLDREREDLMTRNRYSSCEEFLREYRTDKDSALSRLFGEFMNIAKTRHINVAPEDLYRLHTARPPLRLMEALMFV